MLMCTLPNADAKATSPTSNLRGFSKPSPKWGHFQFAVECPRELGAQFGATRLTGAERKPDGEAGQDCRRHQCVIPELAIQRFLRPFARIDRQGFEHAGTDRTSTEG